MSGPRATWMLALAGLPLGLLAVFEARLNIDLALLLYGLAGALAVSALILGFVRARSCRHTPTESSASLAGSIILASVLAVCFAGVPQDAARNWNFERNLSARVVVVARVSDQVSGATPVARHPDVRGFTPLTNVALPPDLRGISRNGAVIVGPAEGGAAVFFPYRTGLFGYAEGFLYVPGDSPPDWWGLDGPVLKGATRLRDHWYWTVFSVF